MSAFRNQRHQHPVGQGLFHAGAVFQDGRLDVTYVYDCGAMDSYAVARDREIKRYLARARVLGRPLDILFLSHVHADHVNGVPKLLNKKTGGLAVDTIMLPLVNTLERLIAFGRTFTQDPASAHDGFYQRFIIDPAAALAEFEPRQIIFVRRGDEGGAPGGGDNPLRPVDDPPAAGPWDEKCGPPWKLVGSGRVEEIGNAGTATSGPRQVIIPDTMAVAMFGTRGAWLLAPYVDPAVVAGKGLFLTELARRLKVKRSKIEAWLADPKHVQQLVTRQVPVLVGAYSAVRRNLNITSMSLYSGPARGVSAGLARWREGRYGIVHGDTDRPAWLGTGDAALKQKTRCAAFITHYGPLLQEVGTLLLPHHGSDGNFHPNLLRATNPTICLAPADQYSNWKHPGPITVQSVCSHPAVLQVVTSKRPSRAREVATLG